MMLLSSPRARHSHFAVLLLLVLWLALGLVQDRAWATPGDRTYRVVGVEFDDVLNIRAGPSADYPVVGEIPPTGRGVHLVGECYGWCPIWYKGASGWVSARYLAAEP